MITDPPPAHRWPPAWVFGLIIVAALLAFVSAPKDGEFWWSDAPRHALNGVFIKDLLLAFPVFSPVEWAFSWYLRNPALTIAFYPPLFYFIAAPFHALLGDAHWVSLWVVTLHLLALGMGLAVLARSFMPWPSACAVALLAMGSPQVLLWGRQTMLEVPSLAFLVWGTLALLEWAKSPRPIWLYAAALGLLAALYTKLTALFALPGLLVLVFSRGPLQALADPSLRRAAVLFTLAMLPITLWQWRFGEHNRVNIAGAADLAAHGLFDAERWLWYAERFPDILGWPLTLLASIGLVLALIDIRRPDQRLLWSAVACPALSCYAMLSLVSLKEERHAVELVPWAAVFAGLALERLRPHVRLPWLIPGLAAAVVASATLSTPVPAVSGYATVARELARLAPSRRPILFSGYRDGAFIFNLRALGRPDLGTLRGDKLVLEVASRRSLGVTQHLLSHAELLALLDTQGVQYAVMQPGFWSDLEAMRRLEEVVRPPNFEPVSCHPLTHNLPRDPEDRELCIYRRTQTLVDPNAEPPVIAIKIPLIGMTIHGRMFQ